MTDILMAVGALGWTWVVYLIGLRNGRVTESRKAPELPKPPKAVCGCKHHYAMHSENGCGVVSTESVLVARGQPDSLVTGTDYFGHAVHELVYESEQWETVERSCPCKRYVGPEPLPEFIP